MSSSRFFTIVLRFGNEELISFWLLVFFLLFVIGGLYLNRKVPCRDVDVDVGFDVISWDGKSELAY